MIALVRFILASERSGVLVFVLVGTALVSLSVGMWPLLPAFVWIAAGILAETVVAAFGISWRSESVLALPLTRTCVVRARLLVSAIYLTVAWILAAGGFAAGVLYGAPERHFGNLPVFFVNQASVTLAILLLAQFAHALPPARNLLTYFASRAPFFATLCGLYVLPIVYFDPCTTVLPAILSLGAAPLILVAQRRAFDNVEMLPAGEALRGSSTAGVRGTRLASKAHLIGVFSPYWRVLTRGFILRRSYLFAAMMACLWSTISLERLNTDPDLSQIIFGLMFALMLAWLVASWNTSKLPGILGGGRSQILAGPDVLFSMPISRRRLFRVTWVPFMTLFILVASVEAYSAVSDKYDASKLQQSYYAIKLRLSQNDATYSPDKAAREFARELQTRYGISVDPAEILRADSTGEWGKGFADGRVYQRLQDARLYTAVAGGLVGLAACLSGLLCYILLGTGRVRQLYARLGAALLGSVGVAAGAMMLFSFSYGLPHIPVSRAFLLSHSPSVATVLVAACVLLWLLCEHYFEYCEVGWTTPVTRRPEPVNP